MSVVSQDQTFLLLSDAFTVRQASTVLLGYQILRVYGDADLTASTVSTVRNYVQPRSSC